MTSWDFGNVERELQSAAIDPSNWPEVLAKLSRTVNGSGALLLAIDNRLDKIPASPDLQSMVDRYIREGWGEHDQRFQGVPLLESKGIFTDQDLISPDKMKSSAFYQDFLAKQRLQWGALVGFRAGGDLWCLSLQRNAEQGPFQRHEVEALKAIWRPFSDAATLSRIIDQARISTIASSLEFVGHAALVFSQNGKCLSLNEAAEKLIGPMIDPKHGTLKFRQALCQRKFEWLISEALDPRRLDSTGPLSDTIIDNKGQKLIFRAIRLDGSSRFLFSNGSVLFLIKKLKIELKEIIIEKYGLTHAEFDICMSLFDGCSVGTIATTRGIQRDSVRTHLKSIFSKTNTHSQAQLVALIARLRESQVL